MSSLMHDPWPQDAGCRVCIVRTVSWLELSSQRCYQYMICFCVVEIWNTSSSIYGLMGAHRKKISKLCFVVDGKMIGFFVSLKQMVTVTASGSGLFAAGPAGLGFKFVAKLPSFSDVFLFLHAHSLITCFPEHSIPLRNISNSIWLHTAHHLTSSAITYTKRQVQPIRWSYFALRQEA